jgi:Zinc-binding dehydrogenase
MDAQHRLLNDVSKLVDSGKIRTTMAENLGKIDAEHLRRAHALIESGRTRGKIVLEGLEQTLSQSVAPRTSEPVSEWTASVSTTD